ncbi:MAG: hypothetical protein PHU71_04615 [Candidatus Gracilibacteria bacterium]|nr:hypothetical protein [Candidatus Gracilibacteria bacterium]
MIKTTKTLLLGVMLMLILSACGATYLTYQSEAYSLEYPSSWKKFDNADGSLRDLDLVLMLLEKDNEVLASFSVLADTDVVQTDELETYIRNDIEPFANTTGYEKLKLEKFQVSGLKTFLHSFKAFDNDSQQKQFLQTYIPSSDRLYVLTASLPVEAESALLADVKRIMRSFQLQEESV